MSDDAADVAPAPRRRVVRTAHPWVVLVGYLLLGLVAVSVLQGLRIVRVYNVPSGSMQQTLGIGDRILVSGLPYLGGGPARGDIVVFGHGDTWDDEAKPPASSLAVNAARAFGDITGIGTASKVYTVKRVIGLPGDTVACCNAEGRLTVNGTPLDEPYVGSDLAFSAGSIDCATPQPSPRCFAPITVPEGHLLVMGDNRSNSADSVVACRHADAGPNCARFIAADRVVGRVVAKAWPPGPVG